jgi:hypothetical protein
MKELLDGMKRNIPLVDGDSSSSKSLRRNHEPAGELPF